MIRLRAGRRLESPGARRRRLPRPHRRPGQPRRRRDGDRRRARPAGRRPAHRAGHLARDPAHHLAVVVDRPLRPAPVISRPAREANLARNRLARAGRAERWRPARDALWALLDRHVRPGASVAVVGAGQCARPSADAAARACRDGRPDRPQRRPEPPRAACRAAGAARARAGAALRRDGRCRRPDRVRRPCVVASHVDVAVPRKPVGRGRYDVVVGDLFYSQLLYPALLDAGLASHRIGCRARRLRSAAVRRGRRAAARLGRARRPRPRPAGLVGATTAHPPSLEAFLADDAALAAEPGPRGCDIAGALQRCGQRVVDRALWRWPFADGVDYLVEAMVAISVLHTQLPADRGARAAVAGP